VYTILLQCKFRGGGGENPFTFEAQIYRYLNQQNGIFAGHNDAIFSEGCKRGGGQRGVEEKEEKEKCICSCTKYVIQSGLPVCKFCQHNLCNNVYFIQLILFTMCNGEVDIVTEIKKGRLRWLGHVERFE